MKRPGAAILLLLATALAVPLAGDALAAELWRWIDADGVPRYTPDPDGVPAARRATLERVEPGMAAAPAREPAPAPPPTAIFAPPGDPALEADPFNEPERAREIESESVEGEVVVVLPATDSPVSAPPTPPGDAEPLHSVDAAPEEPPAAQSAQPAAPPVAQAAPPVAQAAPPAGPVAEPTAPPPSAPPSEYHGEVLVEIPSAAPAAAAPARGETTPAADRGAIRSVDAGPGETASAPSARVAASSAGPAASPDRAAEPPPASSSASDRAARRAELVAAIARDEEALKAHVSSQGAGQLVASSELRAIAERLPALQAELRALDAQAGAP